jgi:hypothetical protein
VVPGATSAARTWETKTGETSDNATANATGDLEETDMFEPLRILYFLYRKRLKRIAAADNIQHCCANRYAPDI